MIKVKRDRSFGSEAQNYSQYSDDSVSEDEYNWGQSMGKAHKELLLTRKVYTPDEMLKLWNQFFEGNYVKSSELKDQSLIDKEDGFDAEFKIEMLKNSKKVEEEKKRMIDEDPNHKHFWTAFEGYEEQRTMDRYE